MKFLKVVFIVVTLSLLIISIYAWVTYGLAWLFFFIIPFLIYSCSEIVGSGLFNDPESQEEQLYAEYDAK